MNKEERSAYMASIPFGKENAKSAKSLALEWETSTRGVRSIISELREDGERICSCNDGYWEAVSIEEMLDTVRRIRTHALMELRSVSKMYGDLKIMGYGIQ